MKRMAAQFACWRIWLASLGVLCIGSVGSVLLHPMHLRADAITVTTCTDSAPGSLRDALARAADGDIIRFGLDCPTPTPVRLTDGALTIRTNLTIDGSGHAVTISGGDAVGLFEGTGGVRFTLNALTLADGTRMFGGGIDNNGGVVLVTNSTFRNATASFEGGAIFNNSGTVAVTNSTFVGDAAEYAGGAIFNAGTLAVTNSTFVDDVASQSGSIDNRGSATLINTLVASSAGGALSGYGGFRGDHNLIEDAASSGGFTDGGNGNLIGHPALLGPPPAPTAT
jgi:hypothetical protein